MAIFKGTFVFVFVLLKVIVISLPLDLYRILKKVRDSFSIKTLIFF